MSSFNSIFGAFSIHTSVSRNKYGLSRWFKSPFKLIEVRLKMLAADLMVRADNVALEQRLNAFHGVGVRRHEPTPLGCGSRSHALCWSRGCRIATS